MDRDAASRKRCAIEGVPPGAATDSTLEMRTADVVVFNVGDNYDFHAKALEQMTGTRGVLILHDAYVLNLFLAWRRAALLPKILMRLTRC